MIPKYETYTCDFKVFKNTISVEKFQSVYFELEFII